VSHDPVRGLRGQVTRFRLSPVSRRPRFRVSPVSCPRFRPAFRVLSEASENGQQYARCSGQYEADSED
jgi:hypothetical protein